MRFYAHKGPRMQTESRRSFPPAPSDPNLLVIDGHPSAQSLAGALIDSYLGAVHSQVRAERLSLRDLDFRLTRQGNYGDEDSELEPDLVNAQKAIAAAGHIVVAFPLWWGGTPSLLKAFFDRTLIPGWAFSMDSKSGLPIGGLAGRTARVVVTMDAPLWYDSLKNRSSGRHQVKDATLKFCGIRSVKMSAFGGVSKSTPEKRRKWFAQMEAAGAQDAQLLRKRFSKRSLGTLPVDASSGA